METCSPFSRAALAAAEIIEAFTALANVLPCKINAEEKKKEKSRDSTNCTYYDSNMTYQSPVQVVLALSDSVPILSKADICITAVLGAFVIRDHLVIIRVGAVAQGEIEAVCVGVGHVECTIIVRMSEFNVGLAALAGKEEGRDDY